MAAEIINLNRARKAKARDEEAKKAGENRVQHGAPKHLKRLGKTRAEKARRDLEAHKKD